MTFDTSDDIDRAARRIGAQSPTARPRRAPSARSVARNARMSSRCERSERPFPWVLDHSPLFLYMVV